ncbi:MAG: hypothetical protein F4227_09715 [Gammaproteobacteria bacterium]|nr:hypothetical protein [Gammaproteobacteria bacterium]MYI77809.1 hypothetical protein [Gammaproteobacteria bacterium]
MNKAVTIRLDEPLEQMPMKTVMTWIVHAVLLFVLTGCASITYEAPKSFDLTGRWNLVVDASDPAPDVDKIWDTERQASVEGRRSDPTASAIYIEQDFPVVKSSFIEIAQDDNFIGLQYEDTPHVDLNWGIQVRDGWRMEVGWIGQALIISKARESIQGVEKLSLTESGDRLEIKVEVTANRKKFSLKRVYDKEKETN